MSYIEEYLNRFLEVIIVTPWLDNYQFSQQEKIFRDGCKVLKTTRIML